MSMVANPALPRDTQAPFVYSFTYAENADVGAVVKKLWGPGLPFVVDRVQHINPTGLAEHASNFAIVAIQVPKVLADKAALPLTAADLTNNTLSFATPHVFETGDGPLRLTTTGGAPTGLATGTDYWAIRNDNGTVKLAASLDLALRGTAIDITGAGTGIQTLVDQATTKRIIAWTATDSDLAGADNSIAANTAADLTLNSLSARMCDAADVLEVLTSEAGTTTLPTGGGTIEGRYLK